MPELTWKELADIRHKVSDKYYSLSGLEKTLRSLYKGANPIAVADEGIKSISKIHQSIVETLSIIDEITIKHEQEDK